MKSLHNRKGCTYSIWLMPDKKCAKKVNKIINNLSKKYNTPPFKPHVTLIGDCKKEKFNQLSLILKKEKAFFPLKIFLRNFSYKDFFFQSLYIKVKKNYNLVKTRNILIKILKINSKRIYEPHMSLIYSRLKVSEKKKIIKKLGSFEDNFITNNLFLAKNDYDNLKWTVEKKIKINSSK